MQGGSRRQRSCIARSIFWLLRITAYIALLQLYDTLGISSRTFSINGRNTDTRTADNTGNMGNVLQQGFQGALEQQLTYAPQIEFAPMSD